MGIIIGIALIIAGISLYEYFTARRWQQITSSDRNEIVFADRNKEYGAYVLRRDYDRNMAIILFSLFASFALSFGIYKFVKNLPEDKVEGPKVETIKKTIVTAKKEDTPPPPPPPPSPPPGPKVVANPPPVIVDTPVDDVVPTQNEVENVKTGEKNVDGDDGVWGPPRDEVGNGTVEKAHEEEIVDFVEEEAEFPGGEDALASWLSKNLRFPEDSDGGTVYLKFVVSRDGSISNITFLRRSSTELEREAQRVVSQMPRWKPGKNDGKAVNSYFQLPINFEK